MRLYYRRQWTTYLRTNAFRGSLEWVKIMITGKHFWVLKRWMEHQYIHQSRTPHGSSSGWCLKLSPAIVLGWDEFEVGTDY